MAGDTPVAAAICLPVQRCRRRRSISSATIWGVGRRNRWGRDDGSCRPANPSQRYRSTHFRTVRVQTPAALAGDTCSRSERCWAAWQAGRGDGNPDRPRAPAKRKLVVEYGPVSSGSSSPPKARTRPTENVDALSAADSLSLPQKWLRIDQSGHAAQRRLTSGLPQCKGVEDAGAPGYSRSALGC